MTADPSEGACTASPSPPPAGGAVPRRAATAVKAAISCMAYEPEQQAENNWSLCVVSAWQRGLGIPNLLAVIAEDLATFDCKLGQAVLIEPGLPPQSPENGNIPETFRNFHL